MMTPDLTPQDVFAACAEVMVKSRRPRSQINGHMVWNHLGRGSKSTVQRYTKEWREMPGDGSPTTSTSLGTVMAVIEKAISGLVKQAVHEEAESARLREAVSAERTGPLASALADAHIEIKNLKKDLAAANSTIEQTRWELDEARLTETKLKAQVDVLKEQLAPLVTGQIPPDTRAKIGASFPDDIHKPGWSASNGAENQKD